MAATGTLRGSQIATEKTVPRFGRTDMAKQVTKRKSRNVFSTTSDK